MATFIATLITKAPMKAHIWFHLSTSPLPHDAFKDMRPMPPPWRYARLPLQLDLFDNSPTQQRLTRSAEIRRELALGAASGRFVRMTVKAIAADLDTSPEIVLKWLARDHSR